MTSNWSLGTPYEVYIGRPNLDYGRAGSDKPARSGTPYGDIRTTS